MTKPIDMMTICVKNKGYTVAVTFKAGPDNKRPVSEEHAYSNLDDLQVGIADLLDPQKSRVLMSGVDFLDGGEMPDDDGWREWEGHLLKGREIPPGVTLDSIVEVQFRNAPNFTSRAGSIIWFHDTRRRDTDVIAYRVVKP